MRSRHKTIPDYGKNFTKRKHFDVKSVKQNSIY